jgi:hypothetical protein
MQTVSYARHQSPLDIIRHAVWLYLRFIIEMSRSWPSAGSMSPTRRPALGAQVRTRVRRNPLKLHRRIRAGPPGDIDRAIAALVKYWWDVIYILSGWLTVGPDGSRELRRHWARLKEVLPRKTDISNGAPSASSISERVSPLKRRARPKSTRLAFDVDPIRPDAPIGDTVTARKP